MAKLNFLSWDTVANSNEDVGGVNIKEGCAPSGINNAIRTIMAQLRADIDGGMVYAAKATNYTAVANDNNGYLRFSAAATLSLTAVATLGADWHVFVQADGGDVIVDPNAAETINGAATITIRNGESALIISNGSAFFARINALATVTYAEKAANYTAVAADNGGTLRFTAGATLALTAAATLGSAWRTTVINSSTGLVIVDPNAAETVNGAASVIIGPSQTAFIVCSGTAFFADIRGDTFSGPQLEGYFTGLAVTNNATDAANDFDIAVGAAAADTSPYNLMRLTSALTKRADASWVVGNNQGALDTGAIGDGTYYVHEIQRSDTGVTDVLLSLSSTAPTMPTSYDRKRLLSTIIRTSSTNGPPAPTGNPHIIKAQPAITPSGTATTYTGIEAGVNTVVIKLMALTLSANAQLWMRLGTGGGIVSAGYDYAATGLAAASTQTVFATSATFAALFNSSGPGPVTGSITLKRLRPNAHDWTIEFAGKGSAARFQATASITLSAELTQFQISSVAGTSTLGGTNSLAVEWWP
jgi:hypothetical protein